MKESDLQKMAETLQTIEMRMKIQTNALIELVATIEIMIKVLRGEKQHG